MKPQSPNQPQRPGWVPEIGTGLRLLEFLRPRQLSVLAAIFICVDLTAAFTYNALAGRRGVPTDLDRADAIIVFCNGIGPFQGVDATTRERLRFAAGLVQSGRAAAVAGIGCHWKVNRAIPDGMDRLLTEFGLWPEAIFIDQASFDTTSNWIEARRIIAEQGWRRLWLLSSPLHLFRIGWLIERETPADERAGLELVPFAFTPDGAGPWELYTEVHHEWLAWGGRLLLPESWFRGYLRWRRR